MKTWAIAAQKGGVGKTTTTVSLAGALVARGARVLAIDLDPHGSLTGYFGHDAEQVEPNVHTVFEAAANGETCALSAVTVPTAVPNLWLVPGSTALVTLERRYGLRQGMGLVLKRALAALSTQFDFCLLDCPPTLGVLVVNALVAADLLVMPVQTEPLSAQAVDRMLHSLQMIERSRGRPLPYLAVPTMFDRRTRASVHTLAGLQARTDLCLWNDVIPVDTQFREASRSGQPLTVAQPHARGSEAYGRLVDDLLRAGQLHLVQRASA
ncbi:MAG: ParA family protein [Gammaproteobacteria bacterium]